MSDRIRELIRERDISLDSLSIASGVSKATLSRLCNCKGEHISAAFIRNMSLYFNEDLERLTTDNGEKIEGLLSRIAELEKENRTLKDLLIDKWGGKPNDN